MPVFRTPPGASVLTEEQFLSDAYNDVPSSLAWLPTFFRAGIEDTMGLGTALRWYETPGLATAPMVNPDASRPYLPGSPPPEPYITTRPLTSEEAGEKVFATKEEQDASPYADIDVPFEPGMTESRLKVLAEHKAVDRVRTYYANKMPWTSFAGRLAGQIYDPINYIPIFGEYSAGASLLRVAGRASLDAAANTAIFGALTAELRQSLGYDVTWRSYITDVAFAGMAGLVLGGAARALRGRRVPEPEVPPAPPPVRAEPQARPSLEPEPLISLSSIEKPRVRVKAKGEYYAPPTGENRMKSAIIMNDAIDTMVHEDEVRLGVNSQAIIHDMQVEPKFPVSVRESAGLLWFEGPKSEAGIPSGQLTVTEKATTLEVAGARVVPEQRGKGLGTDLYKAAVDYAEKRGKTLVSAPIVSEDAARVYDSLAKQGYKIEKNPNVAKVKREGKMSWVSENSREPVYRVGPKVAQPDNFATLPRRAPDPAIAKADAKITTPKTGVEAIEAAAKDEGLDIETGKHNLEEEVGQLRDRELLTKDEETALKSADDAFLIASIWGDTLDAARMCYRG